MWEGEPDGEGSAAALLEGVPTGDRDADVERGIEGSIGDCEAGDDGDREGEGHVVELLDASKTSGGLAGVGVVPADRDGVGSTAFSERDAETVEGTAGALSRGAGEREVCASVDSPRGGLPFTTTSGRPKTR